ncbi:hypothetical protein E2P81_ATG05660 [Venturia nashicola]|nr:hypothetical protein E2P81_ATG05660 [Venturia nashicola]
MHPPTTVRDSATSDSPSQHPPTTVRDSATSDSPSQRVLRQQSCPLQLHDSLCFALPFADYLSVLGQESCAPASSPTKMDHLKGGSHSCIVQPPTEIRRPRTCFNVCRWWRGCLDCLDRGALPTGIYQIHTAQVCFCPARCSSSRLGIDEECTF